MRPLIVVAAACLLADPSIARAQSAASVSLGLSFTLVAPTSPDAGPSFGPGVLLRLRGKQGIGPAVGFNWFSSRIATTIGGEPTDLGRMDVKPVMLGVRCNRSIAGLQADVAVEMGYAFDELRATGQARRAYAERLGAAGVSIRASNALAWKTSVSVWHELGPKWGLMASIGYLGVAPSVTTSSSLGSFRQRVSLGSIVTSVGLCYAVF